MSNKCTCKFCGGPATIKTLVTDICDIAEGKEFPSSFVSCDNNCNSERMLDLLSQTTPTEHSV